MVVVTLNEVRRALRELSPMSGTHYGIKMRFRDLGPAPRPKCKTVKVPVPLALPKGRTVFIGSKYESENMLGGIDYIPKGGDVLERISGTNYDCVLAHRLYVDAEASVTNGYMVLRQDIKLLRTIVSKGETDAVTAFLKEDGIVYGTIGKRGRGEQRLLFNLMTFCNGIYREIKSTDERAELDVIELCLGREEPLAFRFVEKRFNPREWDADALAKAPVACSWNVEEIDIPTMAELEKLQKELLDSLPISAKKDPFL